MARPRKSDHVEDDPKREHRISMEIVVDCYNESECAMGWHCYLENTLTFPFDAVCIADRQISSLRSGETVEVIGMADSDECLHEMFVLVEPDAKLETDDDDDDDDDDNEFAVPLSQLQPISADKETRQAVEDWHYWVALGYQF